VLWVIVVLGVFICVVRPLVGGSSHVPYFRLQLLAQVEQERHCKLTDHHQMESLSGECLRHVVDRGAITPVPLWWCPGPATAQFSAASLHNCVSVEHAVFFSLLGSNPPVVPPLACSRCVGPFWVFVHRWRAPTLCLLVILLQAAVRWQQAVLMSPISGCSFWLR
jgi:hypothetical protein